MLVVSFHTVHVSHRRRSLLDRGLVSRPVDDASAWDLALLGEQERGSRRVDEVGFVV
jgi:hypothetical protein